MLDYQMVTKYWVARIVEVTFLRKVCYSQETYSTTKKKKLFHLQVTNVLWHSEWFFSPYYFFHIPKLYQCRPEVKFLTWTLTEDGADGNELDLSDWEAIYSENMYSGQDEFK